VTTAYAIEIVHADRGSWVHELQAAVADELLAVGLHRSVIVDVIDTPVPVDTPVVVVMLGSALAATDARVAARVREAIDAGLVVLPVVSDLARFSAECPPPLRHLNGKPFEAVAVARMLLRELGIEDRELRVFISHKREDGLWAAEQMYDELAHRAYMPFIDRFAIGPARDVQADIADALEDYAFLLLLETPLAYDSDWVFDEVDYALVRTMPIVIVSWPGDVRAVPGSAGLPRVKLDDCDIELNAHGAEVLTELAVDRVIANVEAEHARGLVRRRRQLVCNVEQAAAVHGARATPLPGWRLLVETGAEQTVVGIAPRLPTASELQQLDLARCEHAASGDAVLVHAARALRQERKEHLSWVADGRAIELLPENAVGARWR
jgi:hypothetical protein